MLYTLHALSELQDRTNIILTQQHYTTFDSRNFTSNKSIEDTFENILNNFCNVWEVYIKKFLSNMINNVDSNKAKGAVTLIPEEGIYLNLQGLDAKNVEYFKVIHTNVDFRLIGIDNVNDESSKNYSFSIFDSPVYDPIHGEYYKPISIFFYKKVFQDCSKKELDDILLRMVNYIILNYMDNVLSGSNNVLINRILVANNEDSNKDAIILPESLNISDTRFIFGYFYTLFKAINLVLNTDMLPTFTDYTRVINLPDIFNFNMTDEEAETAQAKMATMDQEEANRYALGFKQKVYSKIWTLSKKSNVSDKEYIDICSDIMRNVTVNIDTDAYEAMGEFAEESGEEE